MIPITRCPVRASQPADFSRAQARFPGRGVALALAALATLWPSIAAAQTGAQSQGATFLAVPEDGGNLQYRPDAAFDAVHQVYLVVSANYDLRGKFVAADGTPLGAPFPIDQGGVSQLVPRVAWSADSGLFLVSWLDYRTPVTQVYGRMVAYNAGGTPSFPAGEFLVGTGQENVHGQMGAAVAYATGSHRFLVAWMDQNQYDIWGQVLDANGGRIGSPIDYSNSPIWNSDPSVTYNPDRDEFLVTYISYPGAQGLAMAARVRASDGALMAAPVAFGGGLSVYLAQAQYDSVNNRYLGAYYRDNGTKYFEARWLKDDGTPDPQTGLFPLATIPCGSYDAFSLKRNTSTSSYLAAFHGCDSPDMAFAVNAAGTPQGVFQATFACPTCQDSHNVGDGNGNFNPRIAVNTVGPEWLLVTARSFTETVAQRFQGTGGGGCLSGCPPPPPPQSNTRISVDLPGPGASLTQPFIAAGWAIDTGSTSGTGVDRVDLWAAPLSGGGNPLFVGTPTYGGARPDVASAYASSRFTNSGWGMLAQSLSAGGYQLRAYPHSTVSGQFGAAATRAVTALMNPRMTVEAPGENFTTAPTALFFVTGWALDAAAGAGTGVDSVQIWAIPENSPPAPLFLGSATLGGGRQDVLDALGLPSHFLGCGFLLPASLGTQGNWTLIVYLHSTVSHTWAAARIVHVRVL